jgi:hypothetical protein
MAITIPPIPTFTDPTAGGTTPDNARAESWAMLNAKYADTWAMGAWAASIMNAGLVDLSATLGSTTVDADIAALTTEIGSIIAYTPPTVSGGTGIFSDTLLTALRARLAADIATASTGLGSAEAAMFARETARVTAANAKAYSEVTSFYSSRGWEQPPGGLSAKITEMSAESAQNLADSSGKILEESARLAVQYNLGIITASTQLLSVLASVFDSQEGKAYEASKYAALFSVEAYKTSLGMITAKADIVLKKGELALTSKARQVQLEVTTLTTLVQGFQQVVASAMNGVSAGASFGFSGSQNQAFNTDV